MHEAKFTEQIVGSIIEELKQYPDHKPKHIKVKVGEVFHLEKESVLFHYTLLTKGTSLEGIKIDLEEDPLQVKCSACQAAGGVEDHHLLMCSHCGSRDVSVLSGNEIFTEFIDIE